MTSPYITPAILTQADTGISWSTLVKGHANDAVTTAEQANICWRATEIADQYCNQVLRATMDTETLDAPSERVALLPNGICRIPVLARWPVIAINQVQVSLSNFPPEWATLDPSQYRVRNASTDTVSGAGAYGMDIAPGYVSWFGGRYGYQIQVQYTNGWPHATTTATSATGDTALSVDDTSGVLAGTKLTIYDGANTEDVTVSSATAVSGPGTVTLSTGTQYAHASGVLATALPSAIQQACIYIATFEALTRGATAIAIPAVRGMSKAESGKPDPWLMEEAELILDKFKRVI